MQPTEDLCVIYQQQSYLTKFKYIIYQGESEENVVAYAEYGIRKCVLTCPKVHLFGQRIEYFGDILNMVRLSSTRILLQYPRQLVLFRTIMHSNATVSFLKEATLPWRGNRELSIVSLDDNYIVVSNSLNCITIRKSSVEALKKDVIETSIHVPCMTEVLAAQSHRFVTVCKTTLEYNAWQWNKSTNLIEKLAVFEMSTVYPITGWYLTHTRIMSTLVFDMINYRYYVPDSHCFAMQAKEYTIYVTNKPVSILVMKGNKMVEKYDVKRTSLSQITCVAVSNNSGKLGYVLARDHYTNDFGRECFCEVRLFNVTTNIFIWSDSSLHSFCDLWISAS